MRLRAFFAAATIAATSPVVAAAQHSATESTAELLEELIRVNTSNPGGAQRGIADLLGPRLKALGFDVKIIPTPDSSKVHLIARLKGDGSKRPILLGAHVDVVGVERDKWSVEPFAAVRKDGKLYGRGAVDFKGGMAVFARAVMMLAEQKVPLARDVILLLEADEESGGPHGTAWLANEHWSDIDAEFALNEGGWIMKGENGKVRYVSVSTADKLSIPLTLTSHGTSTHSSMPRPDNAIFALSRAMAKLSAYETPLTITPETRQFFTALSRTSTGPISVAYRDLVGPDPVKAHKADVIVSRDPLLHSLVRNTIAPVILSGGFRSNVIPGSAQAQINLRMIPGSDPKALITTLEKIVNDTTIVFELGRTFYEQAKPSPLTTDLYRALEKEAKVTYPGAEVTPYLFQASTDAVAWRSRGVPVYGIYPYAIDPDELTRMHGNDERVGIAELEAGTQMILRVLKDVAEKR